MRGGATVAIVLDAVLVAVPAAAEDPSPKYVELAASIGYAAPVGSAERGSRVSDTTFADVPVAFDAGYRLVPPLAIVAQLRYAVAVPTLCRSPSDCEASLGSDVALTIGTRIYAPRTGPLALLLDVGIGYEWLTTRLAEAGASSARGYHGPLLLAMQITAPFRLRGRWTLGPFAGASFGTFVRYGLQTNAMSFSGDVPSPAVHAWLSFGVRVGFAL